MRLLRPAVVKYRPNDDEAACAWTVAQRRNELNNGGSNLPHEKMDADAMLRQHYTACLAEIAVARLLNLCWTGCGKGSEGLRDVGNTWEVRSVSKRGRGLLVRQKDDEQAPFILVYVDPVTRECELLGWEFCHQVRARGRFLDERDHGCWVLPPEELLPLAARSEAA